ncbi:hypothetical protein N9M87_02135 [Candidatus Pelagibacter bacterium]|nr:hypothetical protein [Candidatus Pelagibacter bacterium]
MINENTYLRSHTKFTDKIIHNKRLEIISIIKEELKNKNLKDILDIGTTADNSESSNIIIKSLKNFEIYKSISDQKIISNFFSKSLQKSITQELSSNEIDIFSSDVVISNATIEHVGSYNEQLKMIENIIKLTKKIFIIVTPNRLHPIEFHTQIPFFHWLPKPIHRKILSLIGLKYLSKEQNLNLLKTNNLIDMMKNFEYVEYDIKYVKFLLFNSNIILIGKNIRT